MTERVPHQDELDTLLGRNRLVLDQEDYQRLASAYPLLREQTEALRLPEARYAEPAVVFRA
jgi:hypothetical protein